MGTTSTSGWALFWFLLGFTVFGTVTIGGGALAVLGGIAMIIVSGVLFRKARTLEGA